MDSEKSFVPSKTNLRREVDAECLDDYINVLECVPDRVAIACIARHLIEGRILDGYGCG